MLVSLGIQCFALLACFLFFSFSSLPLVLPFACTRGLELTILYRPGWSQTLPLTLSSGIKDVCYHTWWDSLYFVPRTSLEFFCFARLYLRMPHFCLSYALLFFCVSCFLDVVLQMIYFEDLPYPSSHLPCLFAFQTPFPLALILGFLK